MHRNLNIGTKNKGKQWEKALLCFQIAQPPPGDSDTVSHLPLRITANKTRHRIARIPVHTNSVKHNGIIFFLYPYISEVDKAAIFPVSQKRKLRPQKSICLFIVAELDQKLKSPNLSPVFV